MPVLEKIVISDFRNIELQEIEFSPNVNCISGNNGEGKTNLLDAIYYLSMTKSAFASSDRYVLRHGSEEFALAATYRMENGLQNRFALKMNAKGEKKVRKDDKPYLKISEHIGVLPVVMVSPEDVSMVSESGEERRRFVNAVLSQMSQEYMTSLQQYNRLLMQRNKMLKDMYPDRSLLEVIDMKMSALAAPVYEARKKFVEDLKPVVADFYRSLSGGSEQVDITYDTALHGASLEELLAASFEKDRVLKHTTEGVHRDDFIFTMNGQPIRRYGSQGQQKSFLVSLKFAQYEIMKNNYGFAPVLLLDDVFDKLDMGRISNLLQMVASKDFGQIFITDSNKVRMAALAEPVHQARKKFVEDLKPIVSEYYKAVSGGSEIVDIEYESELSKAGLDQILASSYEKDKALRYTSSGVQRDDFIFTMNGHPIRRYGSQGQQKSFLVSLKFAQYEIMKRNYGFAPILLLDDVFDKLDMGRIANLLQMVASNDFGQIFITDSNKVRMSGIVDGLTQDRAYFETVSGTFSRL